MSEGSFFFSGRDFRTSLASDIVLNPASPHRRHCSDDNAIDSALGSPAPSISQVSESLRFRVSPWVYNIPEPTQVRI
jgi:hypothetical protein